MLTKIMALYTAFVIFLGSFSLLGERRIPEAVSEEELLTVEGIICKKQLSDDIFAIDAGNYSYEEKLTAIALQGIVAKKNPCIYLITSSVDRTYLAEIEKSGKTVHYVNISFEELLAEFVSYVGESGYILYRDSEFGEGLNVATNYATAYGWLPLQQSTVQLAEKYGLTLKMDISNDEYNFDFQNRHWEILREHFKTGAVVHEKTAMPGLRDLAIQQGYYCFYTDSTDEGNEYLEKILNWSGSNTAILGWTEQEKSFVEYISEMGCYIIPSDICWNNSILASADVSATDAVCDEAVAYSDASKHYVTLVFTDGDNCQWIQNGFSEYYRTVENYPDTLMTWTLSPFLNELNPIASRLILADAEKNRCFISGPSGIGYCNPSCYDSSSLDLLSTRTASAMLKSNQRILTVLDNYSLLTDAKFAYRLGYYSRFDNIDGGIIFLDPDKYQSGCGKVWFSNDKPFVSVRLSLWADGGYEGATDEWIQAQADIVNNYPVDTDSVNGYSVICVHAWSMTPEAVDKFIAALDEHIVLLNADDFLKTLQTNVPHRNTAPDEFYEK